MASILHLVFASNSQKFPGIDHEQAVNLFASKLLDLQFSSQPTPSSSIASKITSPLSTPPQTQSSASKGSEKPQESPSQTLQVKTYLQKLSTQYSLEDFLSNFPIWAINFQRHYFGWQKQLRTRKEIENSLVPGEVCFTMDYSKAYECEGHDKIQQGFFASFKVGILPIVITVMMGGKKVKAVLYVLSNSLENDPAVSHVALRYAIALVRTTLLLTVNKLHVFTVEFIYF
jgi:hypothetical protein